MTTAHSLVTRHSSLATAMASVAALALALPAQAATDAEFFGVCEHYNNQGDVWQNHRRLMTLSARDGVKWVRADFLWAMCEPAQGTWDWTTFDAIMSDAAARGIRVLPILCYGSAYSPHGHSASGCGYVDDDLDGWCTYVSNVVTRYRSQLTAVEVWNEPDHSTFWTGTDAQYVALLKRTYATVKAIDPNITVVLGGLTARATDTLSAYYAAGAKNYFDVMAFHPYIQPHSPSETWETGGIFGIGTTKHSFSRRIDAMRSVMSDNGDGAKPIWLTEMGWQTAGDDSVSEANQGIYTTNAMAIAKSKGIEKYFVYELADNPSASTENGAMEQHFGLLNKQADDFSFKPAWNAVRNYIYRETHGGSTDPYAAYAYLAAGDTWNSTVSFSASGHWSDAATPSSSRDYLVDLGDFDDSALHTPVTANASTTFSGRSLTIGRVGGRAGRILHQGSGSTVTVSALSLNNGKTVAGGGTGAAGQTLAGAITVASPASAPYTFEARSSARDYTVSASLTGAAGTALRGAAASGGSLNLRFTGNANTFQGTYILDGANVRGAFSATALACSSGSGAVTLKGGATIAPASSGVRLSARTLLAADGTGVIDVPTDSTFTLACPLVGTFVKTGGGKLVLDGDSLSGSGTVNVAEGSVSIDAASADRLGAVADGVTVFYRVADGESGFIEVPAGRTYLLEGVVTGNFAMQGAGTLVLDLDYVGGNGGGIDVAGGTVSCDLDTVKYISGVTGGTLFYRADPGAFSSAQTIALFTSEDLIEGTITWPAAAEAYGWTTEAVIDGTSAAIVVSATPRLVVGSDSFEEYARDAEADSLAGWSGDGFVEAGVLAVGDPPDVPLPDATHTNVLTLGLEATRTYADAFARDNQSFDMLIQVSRQDATDDWRAAYAAEDANTAAQLRLSFDVNGAPWLHHGDATTGASTWTRLGYSAAAGSSAGAGGVSPSFADGAWVRLSIDLDYTTSATAAYGQVRIDGNCMIAPTGLRTPGGAPTGGSWFRLLPPAASARKATSITFVDGLGLDDLVHSYRQTGLAPDFPMGAVTSTNGIPFAWFDAEGIPRDPAGDPDGDGYNNEWERRSRTDPLDPRNHPLRPTAIMVQ